MDVVVGVLILEATKGCIMAVLDNADYRPCISHGPWAMALI